MNSLSKAIIKNKSRVLEKLGASQAKDIYKSTGIDADYDFTGYGGLSDKEYPLWQEIELGSDFRFIHRVELLDYGYHLDDQFEDDELPKFTSGSGGHADAGEIVFKVQSIDRFACRVALRGHLNGASFELGLDVGFKMKIFGYWKEEWLGFASETIAEGYAFGCEGRHKQEFFCYFSALDSYIDAEAFIHNHSASTASIIEDRQRLSDKLSALVKSRLPANISGLNDLKLWGAFLGTFKRITKLRDNIAHNLPHDPVTKKDAHDCFCVLSVTVALIGGRAFETGDIFRFYGILTAT